MVTIAAATKEQKQHDDNNQNSHVLTHSFPLRRKELPLIGASRPRQNDMSLLKR
jgi:hypothetical protein